MSIYSGFPTRKDQTHYNQLIARLLTLLQTHLLELLPSHPLPNTKAFAYSRIITKMQQYEQHKYLPPKFSSLLEPLAALIGLPTKMEPAANDDDSVLDTPKERIKTINSNSNSRAVFHYSNEIKREDPTAFKLSEERDTFAYSNSNTRKSSKGSQRKEHKFHGSFYDIQERKIRQMHERYNSRVQEVKERITADLDKSNYRSQAESPGDGREMRMTKYDPANKYGIVHMKALVEAQEQAKNMKNSTPKQRVRTQFL